MTLADKANFFLSSITILAEIIFIVGVFVFLKYRKNKENKFYKYFAQNGMLLAFLGALAATLGSLFYSDILHYEPCKLCWFQRIFMYPQTILLGIALFKKDKGVIKYALTLSIIGGFIALCHYILQTTNVSILPCSAVGYSVACSKVFVLRFGFITIPLMAFSAFLLMIISLLFANTNQKDEAIIS